MIFLGFFLTLPLLAFIIVAGYWKVFTKAGEPGWTALIPLYNWLVLTRIARLPEWWFFLLFVPLLNIAAYLNINIELAKQFGKDAGYGLGLTFLPYIFYPKLGFGDEVYLPLAEDDATAQLEEFGR